MQYVYIYICVTIEILLRINLNPNFIQYPESSIETTSKKKIVIYDLAYFFHFFVQK